MHFGLPHHLPIFVITIGFDLLLLSCFSSHVWAKQHLGNETDYEALLEFKAQIVADPLGVLNSWNHTVHFCQWHGVSCGHRHQRVVGLELNSSRLVGSISPHLANLSFLRLLNLENNVFGHEVPRGIWHLRNLEKLRLANNSITGTIPSNISCSSKLQLLDLYGNVLSGEIPSMIGCFSRLRFLQLATNYLTGKLPPSLGNLSSLSALSLGRNNLTGAIPESLGQLSNLAFFSIFSNGLSGSIIPSSILNLSSISLFSAGGNQFEGQLPAELGTRWPYLESFSVFGNRITGKIPPSISNATALTQFSVSKNWITGSFPSVHNLNNLLILSIASNHMGVGTGSELSFLCSFVNATNLEQLMVRNNSFGGVIPNCTGNLSTHLRTLALDVNNLSGEIPSTIGNLINLEWLSFNENQLVGHIPPTIGSLENMQVLQMDVNNLSGNIPSSLGNLKILVTLTMNNNNLHGEIPPSLGEFRSLGLLDISENKLSGSIPPQLFSRSPFSLGMYLAGNRLTGDLPLQVGNLRNMGQLDISQNLLSGEIPSTLGSCESLEALDMSENLFQETIPSSLSSLKGLLLMNLSNNNLTGQIPTFLTSLKLLNILDLSRNNFEGDVPTEGIFLNGSAIFLTGNSKLCGGILELHLPKCSFHRSNRTWKTIVLCISLVLGVAFMVFVMICFRLQRKEHKSKECGLEDQFIELSYHSLFRATNGFSSANLLGIGNFGAVYKGVLDEGAKSVAIKVFNLLQQGGSKSFMAECKALRNVRHRNLVKILTVCSSIDLQGNDFKALVYEFMSNGSLTEWLHQTPEHSDSNERPRKILSFVQRLSIAIDVASALNYLHQHCETPIVHCDIKPGNVLLDDDMVAHLGDFGLARFLSRAHETSSVGIRGSIGYIPPEYGMGAEASNYGDMYSYGVLLLEMFTGKRPTDEIFQDGHNIQNFANQALPERFLEIIDPTLFVGNGEVTDMNLTDLSRNSNRFQNVRECLVAIMGIGVACSAQLPRERMLSSDVVTQLSSIKGKLLGTGLYRQRQLLRALQSTSSSVQNR